MTAKEWLINYCNETIENEKYRCKKHRQACQRCLDMLKETENEECLYYFDEYRADRVINFFTYLKHSKGVLAGQNIVLDGLSKFVAYNLYGFLYKKTMYRVFKKAFVTMGRKGQKSQLQAGFALYEMSVIATEFNALNECYCAGCTRKQSGVIFEECKLMLNRSPLSTKFKITRDKIKHIKTGSFLEALSKEAKKSGEGTNPCLGIIDEYKDHPDNGFYETLETGMKAQPQPLLIMISTAGNDISVPMYTQEYPYVTRLLNKEVDNVNYFGVICEVEEGDKIDDWRVWEKANQLLFTYEVGIQGLKDSYKVAKEIPEKMTTFLVKNLNMWQNRSEDGYMNMDKFKDCKVDKLPYDLLRNEGVYIGIDISSKHDLCGVTFEIPIKNDDGQIYYYIKTHSFIPSVEKLQEHIQVDKQPFQSWLDRGFISLTNTPIVDQQQVLDYCIKECHKNGWEIKMFCVDPHNASKFLMDLTNDGYNAVEVYQSKKCLNEPTVDFREKVLTGHIIYEDNPSFFWQMGNAKVIRDTEGLIKIDKSMQRQRIDEVDSTMCSHKLAMYCEFESTYDALEALENCNW